MGTREAKVETYLDHQITLLGGLTRKWVNPARRGAPDRIVVLAGRVVFVEVKTVDGVLSPHQRREHERLRQAGAHVHTVYGAAGVDQFVEWIRQQ